MTNLKKLREENNLSVKDMANLLKITKGKYLSWENDNEDIPSKYLYSLSYLFGVGYDEIIAYEKPDDLDFSLRMNAVKKKYLKKVTRLWILLTSIVVVLAILISLIVNLSPQQHAKWHATYTYSKMEDYYRKELGADANVEDLIQYANVQSGIHEDNFVSDLCVITFDRNYMIFFSRGKTRYIIDIAEGHLVVGHGNVHEGELSAYFEVVRYSAWNYIVIYENSNTPLKDLIDCYKTSLEQL